MTESIKITIADDHALFTQGIAALLRSESNIEIADIVNDGLALLHSLARTETDIILLDINMPKLNGLEAAKKIRIQYPLIKVIMLSTYNDEHLIQKAIDLKTHGYLVKTTDKKELLLSLEAVMNGEFCFPDTRLKSGNVFSVQNEFLKQHNLTKREMEILQLVKQAFTNRQMSEKLFLSIYTVETHRKNIMQKLGLNSPASLMKFIADNNL